MKLFNKVRNTGIAIMGGIALLTISAAMTGCSENVESGLYAADGSNIGISIEALGFHNGMLDIGSAQSSTVFTVNSSTRWTVEVSNCEGAWCQIVYGEGNSDGAGHIGDGTFTVEAAPNRSGNSRECTVTVYAIESDGSHIAGKSVEIDVVQDRQSIQVDYAGDEISYNGTGNGPFPVVTVKANQAWVASSSHSWVKIIPGPDMVGDEYRPADGSAEEKTVTFQISVEANPGTSVRYAEVSISSPTSAFTPIRLNVTQAASTETFFITPTQVPQVASVGETIEFQVYSPRESWTVSAISAGDWVTLDKTSGEASAEPVTIRASIGANNTSVARQASLVFTRSGEMGTTVVYINQNASAEAPNPDETPQVSEPWISSGWTATFAQIHAYFSSPYTQITGAGVVYANLDDPADEGRITGTISDNNLITAEMVNLKPNTRYEVWAVIEYYNGDQLMGSRSNSITFTTPALNGDPGTGLPGQDDNNPPSPN
ncbi:MAG: hypothetical protein K2K98_01385 [Muribaculaceae bacterium]|nr:hypothetical protein [Muribaculaceae bacterium]